VKPVAEQSDLETARQLEILQKKIGDGIAKAEQILKKANSAQKELGRIRSNVEGARAEVSALCKQIETRSDLIVAMQSESQELRNLVVTAVAEIGGQAGVEKIVSEYREVCGALSDVCQQIEAVKALALAELGKLQEQVDRSEKHIDELNRAAQAKMQELAMSQVDALWQERRGEMESQLCSLVNTALEELGGIEGLSAWQQELASGKEILADLKRDRSELCQARAALQEMERVKSARGIFARKWWARIGLFAGGLMVGLAIAWWWR